MLTIFLGVLSSLVAPILAIPVFKWFYCYFVSFKSRLSLVNVNISSFFIDGSLKTYFFEEPTSLGRYTKYESTSYTSIGGGVNTFNSLQGYRTRNNDVELLQ